MPIKGSSRIKDRVVVAFALPIFSLGCAGDRCSYAFCVSNTCSHPERWWDSARGQVDSQSALPPQVHFVVHVDTLFGAERLRLRLD